MIAQTLGLSFYTYILFSFFNRSARFGESVTTSNHQQEPDKRVNDIAWAIRAVARRTPWKNVCRHQAYQAKLLCSYYKIPCLSFIGFKKDNKKKEITGHAWTVAGGKMITGFCNPEEYIIQNVYSN
ncbi:MAG: lasso peptide biosynthesis B2 protein [Niabella sp.]|nr:lasso peptide biosynthesis B2 protein [Niabella sp.]